MARIVVGTEQCTKRRKCALKVMRGSDLPAVSLANFKRNRHG